MNNLERKQVAFFVFSMGARSVGLRKCLRLARPALLPFQKRGGGAKCNPLGGDATWSSTQRGCVFVSPWRYTNPRTLRVIITNDTPLGVAYWHKYAHGVCQSAWFIP